ncbi:bifunctional D-cysteine desulfhydrase/1-aminocyclopropane-1-carboxylate deaminase, mitochondrial-like [Mizuhopecten yessoensis]|uniref:1-aminocyclopropane-1-carboxylate deaminase n=1 Tax=Mizuhopecten yessoensis TaxID=6573 RepID=A0A210R0J9_MIZYE|nr:bifunctional D-cysteine desulfhydrase/1-aminocyclopropane-1-carboxylate deaminase, mitochondrial-like [Mizuhopecten yessoensis]OWF54484.1 1-aminocyclopropane-1-carboxylate deaminase [Mizuhopecten yessoensis]
MYKLIPYVCPKWAKQLHYIPKYRIQLANPETPIHRWSLPGVPSKFKVFIKRDDMTGSTLSGNKVRKLEFLMADAVVRECGHVITGGSVQSNHCRATAVAARQLQIQPHFLIRTDAQDPSEIGSNGNLLLDRLCGAHIYAIPKKSPYETEMKPRMEKLAKKLKEETGEESYLMPVGGSSSVGLFGYITVFEELISQGLFNQFDDIVFACGSGGTAAGLSISNHLTGSHVKCHAITVCDDKVYFTDHINKTLCDIRLDTVHCQDVLDIVEGHKGRGYGLSTQDELEFIMKVSRETGIMLDPVYAGKAAMGLVKELNNNPDRFKGERILFLHTGGIFGMFDGSLDSIVKEETRNLVHMWPHMDSSLE